MDMTQARASALILQRRRQFLVHSFLFYVIGESIVPDADFDRWSRELIQLQRTYPEIAEETLYHEATKRLDTSVSAEVMGLNRGDYSKELITVALFLLHRHKKSRLPFPEFVAKHGYYME